MNSPQANPIDRFLELLFGRIDYERQIPDSDKNFDLSKMRELMNRLGNPQYAAPVIHVAGTKGKGSVSVMLGAILSATGKKTGVYTSPHLETIHQRMAIDGQMITDMQMVQAFEKIDATVNALDDQLIAQGKQKVSFFEYTTALAFTFFAMQQCDVVVLETGLGGRLDSTNVCRPQVCVITNISRDHTRILGDTLEEIAGEKAGIIKQDVPVVSGVTDSPSRGVIEAVAEKMGSALYLQNDAFAVSKADPHGQFSFSMTTNSIKTSIDQLQLKMPGRHQRSNAALAIATLKLLQGRRFEISDAAIRDGLATAMLPGRIEIIGDQPTTLLDMAHNPASVAALSQMLEEDLPQWKLATERVLVFGTTSDKDCQKMLSQIIPLFDRVIFTKYRNNPRGLSIEKLLTMVAPIVEQCDQLEQSIQIESNENPTAAWQRAVEGDCDNRFVCVAGSAFLLAEIRPAVLARYSNNKL